jgi:hypothetical protein
MISGESLPVPFESNPTGAVAAPVGAADQDLVPKPPHEGQEAGALHPRQVPDESGVPFGRILAGHPVPFSGHPGRRRGLGSAQRGHRPVVPRPAPAASAASLHPHDGLLPLAAARPRPAAATATADDQTRAPVGRHRRSTHKSSQLHSPTVTNASRHSFKMFDKL